MSSWRDDLPPIPAERIRAEAIREGRRRRERRERRQRGALVGGAGAVAVALIVVSGVLTEPGDRVDEGRAADDTEAPAATEAPTETAAADATVPVPETEAATEPAATEAPAGTAAAEETTGPADTTVIVDHTTIGGPNAGPPSDDVSALPAVIFEEAPTGPACGPSTLDVTFEPRGLSPVTPIVHWETRGVTGEAEMIIVGDAARATIGPFAPDTLDEGVSYEVLVYVTDIDSPGDVKIFRSPTVVLRDCSP